MESLGLADLWVCVWGEPGTRPSYKAGPQPVPHSHPAPAALTDDCRGQAGWLGAGAQSRVPSGGRASGTLCAEGSTPPCSTPFRGLLKSGAGTQLPAVRSCALSGLTVWGARVFPELVFPGGEASTLLGVQAWAQGGFPITRGPPGEGASALSTGG